jgi:hypothetical protein
MQSKLNRPFFILSNFALSARPLDASLAKNERKRGLTVLSETTSRKAAAPQQSQKRAFALHSVCALFDLLVQRK